MRALVFETVCIFECTLHSLVIALNFCLFFWASMVHCTFWALVSRSCWHNWKWQSTGRAPLEAERRWGLIRSWGSQKSKKRAEARGAGLMSIPLKLQCMLRCFLENEWSLRFLFLPPIVTHPTYQTHAHAVLESQNYLIRAKSSGPEGGFFCPAFPLSSPLSFSLFYFLFTKPQSWDLNEDECEESICGIFPPSGWGSSLHLN